MNTSSAHASLFSPECGDPNCTYSMCKGPHPKRPWYMTIKPVRNNEDIVPNPIVLLKVDSWMLEKAYEGDTESSVSHYCT